MDRTTIKVSESTWKRLNAKKSPGDTFEDVLQRLLDDECDASSDDCEHPAE